MEFARKNVQELFSAGFRYKVPEYQRGYAWKNLQIEDYWKDVNEATQDDSLYLGTLILQRSDGADADLFNIVDGQQRITTVCLLLLAARNMAIERGWPQAATLPQLIAFQNIARGETLDVRVEVGRNIREAYEYLVQTPTWDGVRFPRSVDGRKARIIKTNYLFFKDQLADFNQSQLADLLTKVLSNTFFLVVNVHEAMQAFDIFERTNARGVSLNIADLLKNKLFANADAIPGLSDRWDAIVKDSDTTLPKVLKYFDTLRNGHDTGKTVLFSHLRLSTDALGPAVFLHQFEVFSRFMNSAINQRFARENRIDYRAEDEQVTDEINFNFLYNDEIFFNRVRRSIDALALFRVFVSFPVLYAGLLAMQRFNDTLSAKQFNALKSGYIKMLNTIECFHFINNGICTVPTNRAERLYAVTAMEIFAAESFEVCKEKFEAVQIGLREIGIADITQFEESFTDLTYSASDNKPLIAYIFDRLHQDPFTKVPTLKIFDPQSETIVNRAYEVEHIAPRSTWEGEEDTLNNIGNLLILTMPTNREVGNLGLAEKINIYTRKHFDNLDPVEEFVYWTEENSITTMTSDVIKSRAKNISNKAYTETWNPWR